MDTLVRENRSTSNGNRQATEQFVAPAATILETTDGYTLEVEMPGVSKENLEMWVEKNELTILGRRSMPSLEGTLIHRESRPENFRRVFELASDDSDDDPWWTYHVAQARHADDLFTALIWPFVR